MIKSRNGDELYIKFEGVNPTGSFKDRGMAVAVSLALDAGARAVVVASTGNTAASAAAYAARAGLKTIVLLPKGGVARGKLFQSALHGAVIVEVNGNFDKAMSMVMKIAGRKLYPLNSFNPWRLEGQKTIAYEIFEELGCPDNVVVPVGNAGNISAIWKGFVELRSLGLCNKLPRMIGVQASGAAPLAKAWREGRSEPVWIDEPRTVASAIRIGRPVNWIKAMRAVMESGGEMVEVSDDEILKAQKLLARQDGVGAEPAGAASLAGYLKLRPRGTTVIVVTGHALKDPDSAEVETVNERELLNLIEQWL